MTAYLLHSSILLAGLVIFYLLFLRKETFFALNRWTFIFSIIISLVLPLINMPASMSLRGGDNVVVSAFENIEKALPLETVNNSSDKVAKKEETKGAPIIEPSSHTTANWSFGEIIFAIYILGVLIFFTVFLVQILVLLTRKYNLNSIKTGKYTIVELVKEEEPYSFMNTIFINPSIYSSETYDQIIEHEKLHIDQAHFIDKFLAEIMVMMFWFNPFAWMLRSAIGKNLEFLTDQTLLKNGMEKESYQLSLLKVSVSTKPFNMVNSYNNSFLKNRILMMNSKNSSIASTWKYLFILPLFFLSLISLNAVTQTETISDKVPVKSSINIDGEKSEKLSSEKNKNSYTSSDNNSYGKKKAKEEPKSKSSSIVNNDSDDSRKYISRQLDLDPFDRVILSIAGNLVLEQSNEQSVRIEGPEDLVDMINTKIYKQEWNIKFPSKKMNNKGKSINVIVGIPDLKSVGVNGIGNINSKGVFDLNHDIGLACSGVGNIKFTTNASIVSCAVSGTGNIEVKGSGNEVNIALSGSGNIFTEDLAVKKAKVVISGSGSSSVNVSDYLDVVISGSGIVSYRGDPKIKSKYSGSGSAIRRY